MALEPIQLGKNARLPIVSIDKLTRVSDWMTIDNAKITINSNTVNSATAIKCRFKELYDGTKIINLKGYLRLGTSTNTETIWYVDGIQLKSALNDHGPSGVCSSGLVNEDYMFTNTYYTYPTPPYINAFRFFPTETTFASRYDRYFQSFDIEIVDFPDWLESTLWQSIDVTGYFPDATSTNKGLLTSSDQDIGGVKNFVDGFKLNGEVFYSEGTWSPSIVSTSNMTGTAVLGVATYRKIGNIVFASINEISGLKITTANVQTYFQINPSGLPGLTNSTQYRGSISCRINAAPREVLPSLVTQSSSGNSYVYVQIGSQSNLGVINGDTLDIFDLTITYEI